MWRWKNNLTSPLSTWRLPPQQQWVFKELDASHLHKSDNVLSTAIIFNVSPTAAGPVAGRQSAWWSGLAHCQEEKPKDFWKVRFRWETFAHWCCYSENSCISAWGWCQHSCDVTCTLDDATQTGGEQDPIEKAVTLQLGTLLTALNELVQTALLPGTCTITLLRELSRTYSILTMLVKYVRIRSVISAWI